MNKSDIKHNFVIYVLSLIILSAVIGTAAADTSVAWTKDVGSVNAVDMSEDGSVMYAAVGSQIYVYDAAGVLQNEFSIDSSIVKLVCSEDGSQAAAYTESNTVYYIDNGAITWYRSFTDITDLDISNAGSVLVVEGTRFHKYLSNGALEYDSVSGTYTLGAIDPNDEFAIVQSSNTQLQKYLLSTTDQYWDKIGNNTFNPAFQEYQNLLMLYTDENNAIILSNQTLGDELWTEVYGDLTDPNLRKFKSNIAVTNSTLDALDPYSYYDSMGIDWKKTDWIARVGACTWEFDGKMWIGGGYSGSAYLNDVWYSSDGITWTQATSKAEWVARVYASSWVYDGKMWIAGGNSGSYRRDVWYSTDGITWTQATATAQWTIRGYASSWVYDGKMWIAGGTGSSTYLRDVWYSTDGITWTQATATAQWTARYGACSWVFDGKMWIGAGYSGSGRRDVWYSTDGITWTQATDTAGWSARYYTQSWVYDGKMWIGGGEPNGAQDMWYSTDGITWTQATDTLQWSSTRYYSSTWVYDGKMWIAGGRTGTTYLRDVWYSTDGITWTQASISSVWNTRYGASTWVYDGKMWIAGGRTGATSLRDVWYSTDGITWSLATASADWVGRYYASTWVFDGKMWIGAGYTGSAYLRDVWYSTDGITWTQATDTAEWVGRYYASTWVYDNKMWIAGGTSGSARRDVWYSTDGITWTQAVATAQWGARYGAASWVFDDMMWIGAGYSGSGYYRDVWYSTNGTLWTRAIATAEWAGRCYVNYWTYDDKMWIGGGSGAKDVWYSSNGTTWTQATATPQMAQRAHSCSWVFNGKIWLGGGSSGELGLNDVWCSSDGALWSEKTIYPVWSARYGACSWVYDNKMWIGGGRSSISYLNDVWYSTDGKIWTQATEYAPWVGRQHASSWVFDGKMWIAGGYSGSAYLRDVWYSTDGITWTQATDTAECVERQLASSWVFDGKMWIAGGSNGTGLQDVWWSTNGASWTQATDTAEWGTRYGACSWVFDGKMWIGAGHSGSAYLRDVWYSSNGVSWTRATETAQWAARGYANYWTLDGKMWIGGGAPATAKDVWWSTDGITWTQTVATPLWTVRYYVCSWVYNGKMWTGGGYTGSVPSQEVWYSADPYIVVHPAENSPTYIFYNYTGSAPQHTQTTYTNPVAFTGSTERRTKPTLSIYNLQTTKTLSGNIRALSLSDRGDWIGTATATRIYHDQISNTGFGTEYYAALGSAGNIYDISTANSAAMSILGQGQTTDIYSMSASRVGTYTAGGAVTHVDIAAKNALWAASGGEDGKVYVFSKDASSNWYLEYSSDSENPITALRMSARGEYILAGRTNSLTLYQTNTPEVVQTDFWFTLYAYKDSDSYRNAAVNVSVYQGNQWNSFAQGLTDSAGKYVVQLTAGQTYKFDVGNGQKVVVVMASPSVQSQTVNIHTSPISEAISYKAVWNDEINGIDLKYNDNSGQTNSVTVKVQRTDTWETVYEQTFTDTQNIDEQLPIVDDTTSYKVQFSANRVSGTSRNSFVLSSSRDIIPIPLDQNIKNVLFSCFLIVLAGLFSYMSAIRGALVVAFSATLFVYLGWLTIPWHWLIIAIVIAIVAGFTQRRG